MTPKLVLLFAAISGFLSVGLGAFAAHGLRGRLDPKLMSAFETGVGYQMSHTLVLLIVGLLMLLWDRHWALQGASYAFMAGIVLFSGSLYLLALSGWSWPGPITPLGGLGFLIGWGLLGVAVWQKAV
ncbi:DUF423 domain-containing protein [Pseudomonadales bacterium]|nr:DUF423 domain-containing protein [Pseudomonadales bacterium]MDA9286055.1 DUF423 domain-containing protein [Pseudomonadales bacterium]MDA9315950.1 DUF423 domain-containing protein [Pseudomonadales bacterium]MDA9366731.1 DUF423 domain-containing protein [Pseudomonadales bacterium]MDB4151202.1 DUF423 domain-containing protein [Pseudomonadales bacterium]